ncbi:MAG: helix-turn-helix transcriptional regulator [Gammaproteobacteria bacterium]
MELPNIATVRFKDQIDRTSQHIRAASGTDYFVIYLLFKNNERFVLSNIYSHLNDYYQHEFYKDDASTSLRLFSDKNYYLCENGKGLSERYHRILTEKHSVYRSFYKFYRTPDFDIIFGAAHKSPQFDLKWIYQKRNKDFESFILKFIESNLSIFRDHNPELKQSPYFHSTRLLQRIFTQSVTPILTPREIDCLQLCAKGLTANETATALGIMKNTVEEHKKSILKKLNALNMANAIYIAMNEGLFDEKKLIIQPFAESLLHFRNIKDIN